MRKKTSVFLFLILSLLAFVFFSQTATIHDYVSSHTTDLLGYVKILSPICSFSIGVFLYRVYQFSRGNGI